MAGRHGKYKLLKKRLMVEAGVVAVALVAIGGVLLTVSSLYQSAQENQRELRSQLQGTTSQTVKLQSTIEDLGAAAELFVSLSKNRANMDFTIDREVIRQQLAALKERYRLTRLSVDMSAPKVYEHAELELVEQPLQEVDVTVNFGGMSDLYLYGFMEEMHTILSGVVNIGRVQLTRSQDINIEVLSQISRGALVETVSGELQFKWYGYEGQNDEG